MLTVLMYNTVTITAVSYVAMYINVIIIITLVTMYTALSYVCILLYIISSINYVCIQTSTDSLLLATSLITTTTKFS